MHECEKAKIDLSGRSNANIFVLGTFFHEFSMTPPLT